MTICIEQPEGCQQNLRAALEYAVDWTVFPTKPDKRGSYKSAARSGGRAWGATSDPDEICRDFVRWPDAGIGIPTGAGNGIVVVEYDTVVGHGVDGAAALEDLQDRHGRLPDTLQALTASGSLHNYLKHPGAGIKIKCSNSELGPGIDVKGDGGMVIAPPSNGRRWLNRNPIAVMPDWLVELTREPPPKRLSIRERATAAVNAHRLARMFQSGGAGAYAAAALADEIDSLSRAPATTRNTALNKSAFSLGQLVYAGLLQQAEVERHLVDACSANGLTADDGLPSVIATIRSAFHGGGSKAATGAGVNLYDYQQKVVDEYEGKIAAGIRRILIAAPTGSGKTVIASEIIRREVAKFKRVVFLAHRDELLTQAHSKLARFDIAAGIVKAGRDKDLRPQSLVQICGIQTLHARAIRRQTMELPPAEIVIVDEGHHARARTYEQIVAAYPNATIIGLTATPCRSDGRGLGNIFDVIVEAPQVAELITLEKLVAAKIFAPAAPDLRGVQTAKTGDYVISQLEERMNTDALVGDVVEHWLRHSERRRTVGFAVDVAHSVHITRELVKSGVRAEHLDGTTKQDEREAILSRLASGKTEFVSNCAVLTEGFDLPDLGCIVLVRPTKSLLLYRQMIGRGLRTAPGKTDCIILDHAGAVHRHGLPTDPIEWTLHTDQRAANKTHDRRKSEHKDPFCECKSCGHLRQKGFACFNCGWEPKPRGQGIDYIDDNLVELGQSQRQELDRLTFYRELRGYAANSVTKSGQPYSPKWAAHKFREKFGFFPPWSWNDQAPIEPSDATLRWVKSRQIAYAKARAAA